MSDKSHTQVADSLTSCSLPEGDRTFVCPASFGQERLWVLDRFEPDNAYYNIPSAYRLRGVLNPAALKASLDEIVRRHEVLRTTLTSQNGQTVQVIAPESKLYFQAVDLEGQLDSESELQRLLAQEAHRPFKLETGPLVRVKLFRLAETEHVFMLNMHHIISDGWSIGVFFNELSVLYEAFKEGRLSPLPDLPIQYATMCWRGS
jgi:hypothetical protein